jgi:hypothetical protein
MTISNKSQTQSTGLAEGVNPGDQHVVVGRLEIEELDAHADAGLDDADGDQGFEDLAFAREFHAGARTHRERLAGAHETAAQGNVGRDTIHLFAGFKIDQLDVSRERKPNSVAAVANSRDAGIRRVTVGHGDDFAHFTHLE